MKVEGRALKGYRREHLWDTWQRYLPPSEGEPGEPEEPGRSQAQGEVPLGFPIENKGNLKGTPDNALTCDVPQVPHSACPHGELSGDQPDPFVRGRLRCPECRSEVMAS